MIVLVGLTIVFGSVIGGFILAGGHAASLMHVSEFIIIGGAAAGALMIMSPKKVLVSLVKTFIRSLKGAPFPRASYEELFKALYELFMLGRRNGMIALEEHVVTPADSNIFTKYPTFISNPQAVQFLCSGLRPLIDGKVKPEQLKSLLHMELECMECEVHQPIGVLIKTADAMPGFGIVAAVLGIIITMGSISGPIEEIGYKVAAALVGTFLGILLSYGLLNPLAVNIEFFSEAELDYFRSMGAALIAFANGMAPVMAVEMARRGLKEDVKFSADHLETLLKSLALTRTA